MLAVMKFHLEQPQGNVARSFSRGELCINDRVFHRPVLLTANSIQEWTPPPIEELETADFAAALALCPELILLGTGEIQTFPRNSLVVDIMKQGVGFEVMDTAAACRTFNVLTAEYREVVAALLLE